MFDTLRALALLIAANALPVIVAKLASGRWSEPLDFGWIMPDGERLFGGHKTWRGLVSGIVAGAVVGALLQCPFAIGATFAATSLLADAVASAVKRRMHLKPGTEYVGLDQVGEALLPLVLFARPLSLSLPQIVGAAITFMVLDIATERLRHQRWLP